MKAVSDQFLHLRKGPRLRFRITCHRRSGFRNWWIGNNSDPGMRRYGTSFQCPFNITANSTVNHHFIGEISSGNSVPEVNSKTGFFPVNFEIHSGILHVPISPHWRWCVHPSAIRMRVTIFIEEKERIPSAEFPVLSLYIWKKNRKKKSGWCFPATA